MSETIDPNSIISWGDDEWNRFTSKFRGTEVRQRGFSGAIDSYSFAALYALAEGLLSSHDVYRMYGYGTIDMINQQVSDLVNGIVSEGMKDKKVSNPLIFMSILDELAGKTN